MEDDRMRGLFGVVSAMPAPSGGAVAALEAALAAALVGMVCATTLHGGDDAGKPLLRRAHEQADALRERALALAAAHGTAFTAVARALELPDGTAAQRADRADRIREALGTAAEVPLRTAAVAVRVIELCAKTLDLANPDAHGEVGVAAHSARAALDSAALTMRANLTLLDDTTHRHTLTSQLDELLGARHIATNIAAAVTTRLQE